MDSINPYEPPRVYGQLIRRRTRSPWTGPLLSISIGFFTSALITGGIALDSGQPAILAIAVFFGMMGVGCLAASFGLYRRGRYTNPGWETEPGTNIPKAR